MANPNSLMKKNARTLNVIITFVKLTGATSDVKAKIESNTKSETVEGSIALQLQESDVKL